MPDRHLSHLARLCSAILLTSLLTCAQAVELGDTLMRSHLGQTLSADIELTGIVDDAATVQVALADPDVYRGANISMHPALSALNIRIVRREGRRYLHITSPVVVESEHVHIFFDLIENGRHAVRATTLWLTPDPHPAPPPPAAKPAPAPVLPTPVAAPAPVPAALAAARTALLARPAACMQQFTAAQIGTCAALDAKNAALSAQIVELEEKVRLLTIAMKGKTERAIPQRALAGPPPAKPLPVTAKKAGGATPWLFIGIASAAVLALVGVLLYFAWRKRKTAKAKPAVPSSPGFIASVKNRLMPGKKEPWPPVNEEPAAG